MGDVWQQVIDLEAENEKLRADLARVTDENTRLREAMPSEEEKRDRDALLVRLASQNVWLREALPSHEERDVLDTISTRSIPVALRPVFARWLARLDAARKGGG